MIGWLGKILEMNKHIHVKLKGDTYGEEEGVGERLFHSIFCKGCASSWFANSAAEVKNQD